MKEIGIYLSNMDKEHRDIKVDGKMATYLLVSSQKIHGMVLGQLLNNVEISKKGFTKQTKNTEFGKKQ